LSTKPYLIAESEKVQQMSTMDFPYDPTGEHTPPLVYKCSPVASVATCSVSLYTRVQCVV